MSSSSSSSSSSALMMRLRKDSKYQFRQMTSIPNHIMFKFKYNIYATQLFHGDAQSHMYLVFRGKWGSAVSRALFMGRGVMSATLIITDPVSHVCTCHHLQFDQGDVRKLVKYVSKGGLPGKKSKPASSSSADLPSYQWINASVFAFLDENDDVAIVMSKPIIRAYCAAVSQAWCVFSKMCLTKEEEEKRE